ATRPARGRSTGRFVGCPWGSGDSSGCRPAWRYRVMARGAPGMTTADPAHRKPQAAREALGPNRLDGIFGARGLKTAVVAEQGAQQQLVAADQEDRDAAHMRVVRSSNASMLVASR